jgi:5-formyltetrahydrofolate cyclo-ligase
MIIADQKTALRSAVLARRDALDPAVRQAASASIAEKVLALSRQFARGPVSVFWPMRSEVDTRSLISGLAARNFQVCLPVVVGDRLRFSGFLPGDELRRAGFGLQEPVSGAMDLSPTTFLVPLCAFDRRGHRLGYGKGFYDRTIAVASAQRPILTIGIAFSVQEVEFVPVEPHDRHLNAILTESGLITVAGGLHWGGRTGPC